MDVKTLLEIMYILCGVVLLVSGVYSYLDKKNPKRFGSAAFWMIFGFLFIGGPHVNPAIVGGLLLVMGVLSATKSVSLATFTTSTDEFREKQALKIGNTLFIPAGLIGVIAFSIAQFTKLGGLVGLGLGAIISLGVTMVVTKEKLDKIPYDSSRILQQMGPTVILPQLLGSLGSVFAKAGVGTVIAGIMGSVVPEGNILAGVAVYCLSMAIFTMIMGNAFAAFAVITAGIGYPFVIAQGGNPAVVGAMGLTAGYCGTLLTPMGANFNIVPASILEMKNKNGVILKQVGVALPLLIIHIALMYLLAF
ncbi:DUF979 domain-containing protein [uncultured Cetobacterium sp.]|uniref:DUF979 domain-containing protein n=1 Tax=uncultured Cetobacterium sp. TaxID=527638 RepID=UPI00261A81AF|nr:DUF979 domain-containing protein [uncultured Cetobacterium sp.]